MSALGLLMLAQSMAATPAVAPQCDPTTEIVGEPRCFRYGQTWATERMFRLVLGGGLFVGAFDASDRKFSVARTADTKSKGTTYDGDRLGLGAVRTYGIDLDIHGFVSDHVYLGMDMAFGVGRAGPRHVISAQGYNYASASGVDAMQARFGGVLGFRVPARYLSLRVETLVGLEIISLSHDATPVAGGAAERASSDSATFLLEPRIAADLWTAPWASVSVWAGKDVFHLRDTSMGLVFSLHGRSFDGGL